MKPAFIRCRSCREEFTEDQAEGATSCPDCGSVAVPLAVADDVTVKINWGDLRTLCNWSLNHAQAIEKTVPTAPESIRTIVSLLFAQHPNRVPLTLEDEVKSLQNEGHFAISLLDSKGKTLVPPKKADDE
jgi:hypothetical protein